MSNKKFYFVYICIGLLYLIIKLVFVSFGYLHLGAISHGLVPAVFMTIAGLIGLYGIQRGEPFKWLPSVLIALPALVFIITPPFMFWKQGEEWLTQGRLPVLIIYEVLAVVQFVYSLRQRKSGRHYCHIATVQNDERSC